MGASTVVSLVAALALMAVGAGIVAASLRALSLRRREASLGALVAIDAGDPAVLVSARHRLEGRPDALRRTPDGRLVPVEVKSRTAPRAGPARSHCVQIWAYCLLVEETTGRSPPFGVLRYADREVRVRWDAAARGELLALRADVARPYDGRATPSAARCARCAWVDGCDARVLAR